MREHRARTVGARQVGALEGGTLQPGTLEVDAPQIEPGEIRPREIHACKVPDTRLHRPRQLIAQNAGAAGDAVGLRRKGIREQSDSHSLSSFSSSSSAGCAVPAAAGISTSGRDLA